MLSKIKFRVGFVMGQNYSCDTVVHCTVGSIYHPDTVDGYAALRDQVKPRWAEKRTREAEGCIMPVS